MKHKLIFLIMLISLCLCSTVFAGSIAKLGDTTNGVMYINTQSVQSLRKGTQLFLLVQLEEQYTNQEFLARLRASKPQLQRVSNAAYLYMFTNDGLRYCIPRRLLLNPDETIALDLGQDMKLQPVKSHLLMRAYEEALTLLERKKQIAHMYK